MLPHAGTDSRIWREVVELGANVAALSELQGTRVRADVAIVWDWESWWGLELEFLPTVDLDYQERIRAYYEALWHGKVTVDFVSRDADLTGYRLVVAPSLYIVPEAVSRSLAEYVDGGGRLVVSFFSGLVDESDKIPRGPHPGATEGLTTKGPPGESGPFVRGGGWRWVRPRPPRPGSWGMILGGGICATSLSLGT
jgi:beta-galactosidase